MMRTQFVALGSFAVIVAGSAGLGIAAGGDYGYQVHPDDVYFTTIPPPNHEPRVAEGPPIERMPLCADVWVVGQQLPKDYEGCKERPDSGFVASLIYVCGDGGGDLTTHEDRLFGRLGGTIREYRDAAFRAEFTACTTGSMRSNGESVSEPEDWVMSPDAFGPITTQMTSGEIVRTGAYKVARGACGLGRLGWHSQTYEEAGPMVNPDGSTATTYVPAPSRLPEITLDGHGMPQFIDPGSHTKTDAGIGLGDSVEKLEAAYPGLMFREELGNDELGGSDEVHYGVSGKRSHLVFYAYKGIIEGFYLTPGALSVREPFGVAMRGIAC